MCGLEVVGQGTYCNETCGDNYEFLVLDAAAPDSVLVALGDGMGHGVAAGLVMAGARAVLCDPVGADGGLAKLMGRLHRLLAHDPQGERGITMHLAVVDGRTRMMRWVRAGHDPARFLDPAAGTFDAVDAADLPLGLVPAMEDTEHSYGLLRAGQVVLMGTDGVWKMPNAAGGQFGKDRRRDVVRAAGGGTAAQDRRGAARPPGRVPRRLPGGR